MGLWVLKPLLISLILTLGLEIIVALLYGIQDRKDQRLLVLVNVITNPPVVLIYYLMTYYTECNRIILILLLELAAIFIEAYYFKNYGKTFRRPILFAFLVNLISYGIGRIINTLFY